MLIPNLSYNMDDDVYSDDSYDSDRVDSDIEAELYSTIHHEAVSTEPDSNPEKSSSINFISVEENSSIIEREVDSNTNLNMNSGKDSKSSVGLKRKSNLVANILGTIQLQESKRKKRKTVNRQNKSEGPQSSSRNATIELSDSDSSVILSEPDESLVLKMQTNVETLCVSSDSESSVTCLDESRMSFNFIHSDDNNSNGNNKDVWKINDTDLYRTKRNASGRYHENAISQCSNCKQKGHIARYCTEAKVMKCFICGGAHMGFHCKNKICIKCLRYGHDSRRCFFPFGNLLCSICNMRGHAEKCCPDLWRRYHLTTVRGHIVRGPSYFQSTAAYCFNCGLQGHFGHECNKSRMSKTYPTWPSVVSYEHTGLPIDEFQTDCHFQPNFPPANVPCVLSARKMQRRLIYKQLKKERNRIKRQKKAVKSALKKSSASKQEAAVNSSVLSNSNSGNGNVRTNQLINFPRTPKANPGPPQCVDETPAIMNTPKRPNRKTRRKEKRQRKLERKQLRVLKNCS